MNARHAGLLLVAATLLVGGCSDRKLRPLNPCTVTGVVRKVSAGGSENVDLLLMIDNSGSMESEQLALQQELPNLAEVLLTGDLDGDGSADFPGVESLRVGVINSDMGLLGIGVIDSPKGPDTTPIRACGDEDLNNMTPVDEDGAFFGNDGQIQLVSSQYTLDRPAEFPGCDAMYPDFLEFSGDDETARDAFVADVACTAVLGTTGCGFEMQLESILVAITDSNANPEISFYPGTAQGASRNRSGQRTAGQANEGFFRDDSVIAIVAVTDEEDCSTDNPEMFMFVPSQTDLMDPEHAVEDPDDFDVRVNTRCTFFDEELYPISRYVQGLQALRPDDPNKIVFAGIVGVPTDLQTATFDAILDDDRMDYVDRIGTDGRILDNAQDPFIEPACWRCLTNPSATTYVDILDNPDTEEVDEDPANDCDDPIPNTAPNPPVNENLQWAAPGRRFVQLADAITDVGMNAVIRSICTDDFGPAMQTILERIGDVLRGACLPRPLNPDATGQVNCDVVEILPVGVTCAQRAQVGGRDPTPIRTETAASGGVREVCRVTQRVPVGDVVPTEPGWFYDDFSTTVMNDCPPDQQQRIGFIGPDPIGDVRLECLQPVQGGGLDSADISTPCVGNAQCELTTVEQMDEFVFRYNLDRTRFIDGDGTLTGTQPMACEGATRTCQIGCGDASDCPGGFVCLDPTDNSSDDCGSTACFCANPTCVVGGAGGGGTGGGSGGGGGGDPDAG